jgi:macrodomain Ter protein organizer (MatP/YcbG family)
MQEIRADRRRRMNAEKQHQQRSHQRAAADARETHNSAHGESG